MNHNHNIKDKNLDLIIFHNRAKLVCVCVCTALSTISAKEINGQRKLSLYSSVCELAVSNSGFGPALFSCHWYIAVVCRWCATLIDASRRWRCSPVVSGCFPAPDTNDSHTDSDVEGFFFFFTVFFFSPSLLHIKFAEAYHELTVDWISCFKGGMLILTGGIECGTEKPTQAGRGEGTFYFFIIFFFF